VTRPAARGGGRAGGWLRWGGGTTAAAAVLMYCYLRTAGTVPVLSDGAGNALEAWDMLHGNLLLHGWWVTDVSFWTTELPQYAVVLAFAGLRTEVVHICAALTYTLLVLLAAYVARGRSSGAEAVVRAVLAAGIMLAPEPGAATWVLLSDPDHVGTAVPVLVMLLVLDWARPRWWLPCLVFLLLTWATVGDPLVTVIGAVPVVVVCVARVVAALTRRREKLRAQWYLLSLAGAAALSVAGARAVGHVVSSLGGFGTNTGVSGLVPLGDVASNVWLAVRSVLAVFGADPWDASTARGEHGISVAFADVHLAGVALVLAAVALAAWRLVRALVRGDAGVRWAGDASRTDDASRADVANRTGQAGRGIAVDEVPGQSGDLVADVLVVAVVVNVLGYLLGFRITNIYAAHEVGPVLSLGAALAGRELAGPLLRAWRMRRRTLRLLAVCLPAGLLACYCAMLGFAAAQSQTPPASVTLAAWLSEHGLRSGLSGYWEASSVTLDTGGAITMGSVVTGRDGRVAPRHWEMDMRLFDPADHQADFLVLAPDAPLTAAGAVRTFGQPERVYRVGTYTIMVWDKNLLPDLAPAVN
jgi:hypothetical protein